MPRPLPERRRGRERPRRDGPERLLGVHAVREALRARRRPLHRLLLGVGRRGSEVEALREAAVRAGVPVEERPAAEIAALAGPSAAQGVVLEAGPLPELALEDLLFPPGAPEGGERERTLVALDGVEDPQNLGAICRAAEGAGAAGLILTRRRAPPLSPAVARASAGALEWLPVARVPNLVRALNLLKERGFWVLGATPDDALDLYGLSDRLLRGDRVLVLGAEGRGLRPGVGRALDHRVRIPMAGKVDSLNVGAAAAVLLFELRRRAGAGIGNSPVSGLV